MGFNQSLGLDINVQNVFYSIFVKIVKDIEKNNIRIPDESCQICFITYSLNDTKHRCRYSQSRDVSYGRNFWIS